jgi:hypothetical protein
LNDAERIAALLDGQLDARQRAEVLARLGGSEAAMEAFADAAAVLGETTELATGPRATPWRIATVALAAGVVAAIVLVPVIRSHFSHQTSRDPTRFAALLSRGVRVPTGWNGTPWSMTRGNGEQLTTEARASRIGARLVDLDLATRTGDTGAAHIATDVRTLLDPLPAAGPVVAIYRALSDPATNASRRDSLLMLGRIAAADIAGRDAVDLGAWTEAARVAAADHDTTFFRSAVSRDMLPRAIERLAAIHPDARILYAAGTANWTGVEDALTTLLQSLGS